LTTPLYGRTPSKQAWRISIMPRNHQQYKYNNYRQELNGGKNFYMQQVEDWNSTNVFTIFYNGNSAKKEKHD
jgi:hypothetical protein